jgi:hypothetical protein
MAGTLGVDVCTFLLRTYSHTNRRSPVIRDSSERGDKTGPIQWEGVSMLAYLGPVTSTYTVRDSVSYLLV